MFAIPTNVGVSHRVVATLVASAVLLWSIGVFNTAQAANLTSVSDTLSDSDLNASSNHTIEFTVPTSSPGVVAAGTVTVTFPAGFVLTGITFEDVDLRVAGVDQTLAAAAAGATWGVGVSGQVLTLTSGTGVITATQVVEIQIGTNATFGTAGIDQIENPAVTDSYEIVVTAGTADSGRTQVAILDNVLVSAVVNTAFDFTVTGLATSTAINGGSGATTGSSSNVALPFGVLTSGVPERLAQRLNVTTNARNGFVVTVETDGDLQSSNGAVIDIFDQGVGVYDTGTAWNAPVPNVNDPTSWGHWGITTADGDLNSLGGYYTGELTGNNWLSATVTPQVIFHHDGPSDGLTTNIGSTTVAYQIEITSLQEAADDYNTTLTYIATPTF